MNFHVPALATHSDSMETSQPPVKRRPDEAPRVLSVENDILLQSSRAQVMERAGCSVHSCTSVEVLNLIRRRRYTVAVFGHCLANQEAAETATFVRTVSPWTKLLLLNALEARSSHVLQLFDASLHSSAGPAALISLVRELSTSRAGSDMRPAGELSRSPSSSVKK